jgi:hypothetical protein
LIDAVEVQRLQHVIFEQIGSISSKHINGGFECLIGALKAHKTAEALTAIINGIFDE